MLLRYASPLPPHGDPTPQQCFDIENGHVYIRFEKEPAHTEFCTTLAVVDGVLLGSSPAARRLCARALRGADTAALLSWQSRCAERLVRAMEPSHTDPSWGIDF